MLEKTAEEIYDRVTVAGEYREKESDELVLKRMFEIAVDNTRFIETLFDKKVVNWRVVFLLYYDSLRGLCNVLLRLNEIKCSNHQGCFAYTCVKFPDLELDWNFFDKIRFMRNGTYYEGKSIEEKDWKEIGVQMKLYVSTLEKDVGKKLDSLQKL